MILAKVLSGSVAPEDRIGVCPCSVKWVTAGMTDF
jgi:3-polyprenyl-4-hydroxybenzoate decarboxylase